jgi:nucleoside recognition membrane protein YjiH
MSIIGVFLFMALLPTGDGAFNIPLGFAINWLGGAINSVQLNGFGLLYLITCIVITISFLGSVLAYTVKPAFIMENEMLKRLFLCNIVYFISKAVGFVIAWLVFLSIGPGWLIASFTGDLMMELISSSGGLMAIFIVLGIAIPLLTDFGLMEFLGILIRKVIRFLFTLPGRSSVDLLGSWFSSSAASVIITRDQHEKGYYTGREAAAICVNFTLVSLPFTFFVAGTIDLLGYFPLFYLVICVTAILLAIVMPRIWPLRGLKDEYLPEVGKQIDEEPRSDMSLWSQAVRSGGERAGRSTIGSVIQSGLSNWLNIFMDLIPVILAWGTIALIINEHTPIFQWLSWPFGWYLELFRIPGAFEYAPATIVGFIDMFIPALLLGGDAPFQTRFILGALSIVQIIYLAETGILILKSRIPLHIGHLAVIFLMRTIFAIPVIVFLTWLLF